MSRVPSILLMARIPSATRRAVQVLAVKAEARARVEACERALRDAVKSEEEVQKFK